MTKEERLKILKLKKEGFGYKTISTRLNISLSTVKSVCKRESIYEVTKCKQCGEKLIMIEGKKSKKFCSDKCRMSWWYQHQNIMNKNSEYQVKCACCNKTFSFYGYKNRKYCSRECYMRDKYGSR